MVDLGNFDVRSVDPQAPMSMLPVSDSNGWLCVIEDSEAKPCKSKGNGMLELSIRIIDGPYKGERGKWHLNLWHQSKQTSDIAWKSVSAIGYVVGVFVIPTSQALHNLPFRILVRQQIKDPEYTEVYGVKDINGNDPGKAGQAPAAAQPTQAWNGQQGQQQPVQQAQPTQWANSQPPATQAPATPSPQSWTPAPTQAPEAAAPPTKPPWQK